ncbi:MAG TPA: hypothetical protein VLK89_02900 [Solirubrobacterales bacterium]|nr:hypothetical protein [Solirubrobacterales bacterium]
MQQPETHYVVRPDGVNIAYQSWGSGPVDLLYAPGFISHNIGARVGAAAGPGEVLVSSTVAELVMGSGLCFEERGSYELKGCRGGGACWRSPMSVSPSRCRSRRRS